LESCCTLFWLGREVEATIKQKLSLTALFMVVTKFLKSKLQGKKLCGSLQVSLQVRRVYRPMELITKTQILIADEYS